jgi:uroporphyrinogen decarboxylase
MTSKERVKAAINHKESDRIPIDLGGFNASTILAEAYDNLLSYLDIDKEIIIGDTSQFWVMVDQEIMDVFGCDVVPVYPLYDGLGVSRNTPKKDWVMPRGTKVKVPIDFTPKKQEDGSFIYEVGDAVFKLPDKGYYFDLIKAPFNWLESPSDVEKVEIPVFSEDDLQFMKGKAEYYRVNTDKFVIGEIFGGWFDIAGPWLGNEKFYMDLITNQNMIHALFEKMNDVWKRKIQQLVESVGVLIDAVPVYNDLGSNTGGMFSVDTVRETAIPYIRDFMDYVEKVSNYDIIFHSCGSVTQYIPDLIKAGVKILNPVQMGAADMEPEKLKSEYGNDIVFWGGGIDAQHTYSFGTSDAVISEVKRNIDIFKRNGGFVFGTPHNVQANVKPENIYALYNTAKEYGVY